MKRRERLGQIGRRQLENALGLRQILQMIHPEISELRHAREDVPDQRLCRLGQQRLTPVTQPTNPGAAVDCRPVVIAILKLRLASVDVDPDLERAGGRPAFSCERSLDGQRRGGRRDRAREDGEAAITFAARPDVRPGMIPDGGLEQHVVGAEGDPHHLGILLPERRAPHDVGEEKCDRPGGQIGHAGCSSSLSFSRSPYRVESRVLLGRVPTSRAGVNADE